jgi:hypothetical protein
MMRALFPFFAALAAVSLGVACSSFDQGAITEVTSPDFNQFSLPDVSGDGGQTAGVSALLEHRCGTLDCHGQMGRPMRIFGMYGLRLIAQDAANTPGVQPTTQTEYVANYQSVIGLQPELMTEVVQQNAPPTVLMLLRKPMGLERHKGGQVINQGDDAYTCLTSWLVPSPEGTSFSACAKGID